MSDFEEKDRTEGAEPGNADTVDAPENAENEDLGEELEQIRDMFQQELDKQDEEILQAEIENSEADTEAEAADEGTAEFEGEPCECCGERERDTSYGEDYPYCTECRRLMTKSPLGFKGFGMILLALVITALSVYIGIAVNSVEGDMYALQADQSVQQGKPFTGLNSYISYFSAAKPDTIGKKVALRAAQTYASFGYFSDAKNLADQYFTETDLNLPSYRGMKALIDDYNTFYVTYQTVSSIVSEPLNEKDVSKIDYEGLIKQLDELKTANPKDADETATADKYDEFFIEYYKFVVLVTAQRPLEEQYEQIKKVEGINESMLWAYGANLCSVCAKLGKVDEAEEIFNRLIESNTEDQNAYAAVANAYRFCDKPDADKMIEILNKGVEISPSMEFSRLLSVAYLMKGDYKTALTHAQESLQSGYTFQNIYTLAVCAILNKDTETYNQAEAVLKQYKYEMSDAVLEFKAGKVTLDEILYDAQGDLA